MRPAFRPQAYLVAGVRREADHTAFSSRWIRSNVHASYNACHKRKGEVLFMAKSRSTRNTRPVAKTTASRKPQQRKGQRLFQSDVLTALFGRSRGTLVKRSVLIVAAVGLLAIIAVGLLHPASTSKGSAST